MEAVKKTLPVDGGKFLSAADRKSMARERRQARMVIRRRKGLAVLGLLLGDGLLIYMILGGLIDQLYGTVFVAVNSAFFSYQLKGE